MILSNQVKASVFAALLVLTAIMYFSISLDGQTYEETIPLSKIINPDILVNTKKSLPQIAIAPRIWHKYPGQKWRDLQLPVLISNPMGRLGNVMGEYATLLALGRVYGTTVRLHPSMQQQLITFPNISIPLLPGALIGADWTTISSLTFINYGKAEAAAAGILGPGRFLLTDWPFEMQLFNTFRLDLLREFTFQKNIQDQVRKFWKEKLGNNTSSVRIGIHVRRGDYVNFIHQFKIPALPEDAYFKRATDYYRAKFNDVRFLVASDDMSFVKKLFANYTDVLYTPGSPRELDLALLASCNHSIITIGSFGFWCGYLTGGEVVYPNINATDNYMFQKSYFDLAHLDNFTPLPPY